MIRTEDVIEGTEPMTMQYGTQKVTKKINDSTNEIEATKYMDSEAIISVYFEQRVRVENPQEELAEYIKFNRETTPDQRVSFNIDRSKRANQHGYYYVIKAWYK